MKLNLIRMDRIEEFLLRHLLKCFSILAITLLPFQVLAQKEFYTPKSLIIPLHDKENQLHVSVGKGGGYDLNLSYALTDKLAIFSAATFDTDTKKRVSILSDKYNVERNDLVLKGGFGYLFKEANPYFPIIEAFVGAGASRIDNYWYFKGDDSGEVTNARYWTAFGQLNAGNKIGRSEYGVGIRLAYSHYTDFDFYDTHPYNSARKSSYENLKGLTADPVVSYSYNLYGIKLNAQVGLAVPVFTSSANRIDTQTTFEGTSEIRTINKSKEDVYLFSVLGRLSVQYNLNFNKQK